jgi:transcriptional antiterminator
METIDNTRDKSKGGRGLYPIERTKAMKDEIRTYVLLNAGHNIPYTALSQKWGVAQSTILSHVQRIIKEEVLPNVDQSKSQMKMGFIRVMEQAHTFMNSANEDKRIKGAELLLRAQKDYTEFLERWGDKFKPVDNVVNVQNNVSTTVDKLYKFVIEYESPKEIKEIKPVIDVTLPVDATGKNE